MNKNVVYANGFDDSAKLLGTKEALTLRHQSQMG